MFSNLLKDNGRTFAKVLDLEADPKGGEWECPLLFSRTEAAIANCLLTAISNAIVNSCRLREEFSYPAIVPTNANGEAGIAMTYTWNRKRIRYAYISVADVHKTMAASGAPKL